MTGGKLDDKELLIFSERVERVAGRLSGPGRVFDKGCFPSP